jgi:hypothetical protein
MSVEVSPIPLEIGQVDKTVKICPHVNEVFIHDMASFLNFLTVENYDETFKIVKAYFYNLMERQKVKDADFGFWLSSDEAVESTTKTTTTQNHIFHPQRLITLKNIPEETLKNKRIVYIQTCKDLASVLTKDTFEAVFSDIYLEFKIFTFNRHIVGQSVPSEWTFECVF